MGLVFKIVIVIRNNNEVIVLVEEVIVGDIILVKLGEKLFVDGEVVEGSIVIDELMFIGESIFVEKIIGSNVIGVSINKIGFIKYKVIKVGKDIVLV